MAVRGSEAYADQGEQLLTWEECEPQVEDYCRTLELPSNPVTFVNAPKSRLMATAEQTDQEYVDNGQVVIDYQGMPVPKRNKAKEMTGGDRALETAIHERLKERSVVDVLCDVRHWTNWHRHFGPL